MSYVNRRCLRVINSWFTWIALCGIPLRKQFSFLWLNCHLSDNEIFSEELFRIGITKFILIAKLLVNYNNSLFSGPSWSLLEFCVEIMIYLPPRVQLQKHLLSFCHCVENATLYSSRDVHQNTASHPNQLWQGVIIWAVQWDCLVQSFSTILAEIFFFVMCLYKATRFAKNFSSFAINFSKAVLKLLYGERMLLIL